MQAVWGLGFGVWRFRKAGDRYVLAGCLGSSAPWLTSFRGLRSYFAHVWRCTASGLPCLHLHRVSPLVILPCPRDFGLLHPIGDGWSSHPRRLNDQSNLVLQQSLSPHAKALAALDLKMAQVQHICLRVWHLWSCVFRPCKSHPSFPEVKCFN